jgi:hypothetical protein
LRHGDGDCGIRSPEALGDLADPPPRRSLRTDDERSFPRPEDYGRAMIPVLDGVPGIPGVPLVLRLERLKIRGGSGVAQLRGVDAGGHRFPSTTSSEPVAELDVTINELGQFRIG